jgi:hypothetical protein
VGKEKKDEGELHWRKKALNIRTLFEGWSLKLGFFTSL